MRQVLTQGLFRPPVCLPSSLNPRQRASATRERAPRESGVFGNLRLRSLQIKARERTADAFYSSACVRVSPLAATAALRTYSSACVSSPDAQGGPGAKARAVGRASGARCYFTSKIFAFTDAAHLSEDLEQLTFPAKEK